MKPAALALLAGLTLALPAYAGTTAAERGPRPDPVARLAPAGPSPWHETLGDPVLADLLKQADLGALEIKTALARLELAEAELERAKAPRGPRVTGGVIGAAGAHSFSERTRGAVTPTLDAAYEVDLWGRLSKAAGAAQADRKAAEADIAAARLLVAAETARAYTALRIAQAADTGAAARQVAADRALEMTQQRAAAGTALGREVEARRAASRAAADQLLIAREEVALQTARIAALIGKPDYAPAAGAPIAAGAPPATVASSVVDKRPDVQAALARLAAADQKRAEAIAATKPRFEINLGLGSPEAALVTLLDVKSLAWVAAANLTQPLLDGGARRANLHAATAEADIADIAYRQTLLTAWTEVRAAGIAQARARRALAASEDAVASARAAALAGDKRHEAGAADAMGLVDLGLAVHDAEDAARLARGQETEARIALALATGGG